MCVCSNAYITWVGIQTHAEGHTQQELGNRYLLFGETEDGAAPRERNTVGLICVCVRACARRIIRYKSAVRPHLYV